jgi:K+-sensing histidine kinase KdpD
MEGSYRGADLAVAQWVADHGRRAGLGSDTLPAAPALYLPLGEGRRGLGVLAVRPRNPRRVLLPEQRHLLETLQAKLGWPSSAPARRTAAGRASRPSARACATRCWRRSRTICVRRSRPWPVRLRRSLRAAPR